MSQKLVSIFVVVSLTVQLAVCGHHKHHSLSSSEILNESEKARTCPLGFERLGKECVQTLTAPAEAHCPIGFDHLPEHNEQNQCAKLIGKLSQCPAGYFREAGMCTVFKEADAERYCPEGYTFTSNSQQCVKNVPLAPVQFCPVGSVKRDELCVIQKEKPPQYVCPPGFKEDGHRCFTEDTYDCTPENVETYHNKHHHKKLRMLGHSNKHQNNQYMPAVVIAPAKPTSPPLITDRVVQKTCKRTRLEDAQRICDAGTVLSGKGCVYEEHVELLSKPGGFREEFTPPAIRCPKGFNSSNGMFGRCVGVEEVIPEFYCPPESQSLGDKCGVFKPVILTCPADFKSDHQDACVKVLRTPPISEYTVTIACTDKDCPHHHHHHH